MTLSERIQKDLTAAMKAKEPARLSVLRLIKTAVQNKEIDVGGDLSPEVEIQILQTMVKQRNEAIETFEKAGRSDLAEKEKAEKTIIQSYLPEEISEEEIERVASEVVEELGATSPKDMGKVMKETMVRLKSTGKTVDGKAVNAAVRARLS